MPRASSLESLDDDQLITGGNTHQIKLTRLAMRALLGRDKTGVVALIASMAGYTKHYSSPLYAATKHALVGFTRSMGDSELLQGVKVVAICPGYVRPCCYIP
jgi:NAD(P)-dependent dehydrogenase (short-subunit alcohol dehydrogenase family)